MRKELGHRASDRDRSSHIPEGQRHLFCRIHLNNGYNVCLTHLVIIINIIFDTIGNLILLMIIKQFIPQILINRVLLYPQFSHEEMRPHS